METKEEIRGWVEENKEMVDLVLQDYKKFLQGISKTETKEEKQKRYKELALQVTKLNLEIDELEKEINEMEDEDNGLLTCFKCGDKMREADAKRWYHGDQDDLICPDCASETKHTDTSYAGMLVSEESN